MGIGAHPMTEGQYRRLVELIDKKEIDEHNANAIDYCLEQNSYSISGWDSLVDWMENNLPDRIIPHPRVQP